MKHEDLYSYLANMLNDRVELANVHGSSNLMNANFMLTADALCENVDLFTEVIKERFEENKKIYRLSKTDNDKLIYA